MADHPAPHFRAVDAWDALQRLLCLLNSRGGIEHEAVDFQQHVTHAELDLSTDAPGKLVSLPSRPRTRRCVSSFTRVINPHWLAGRWRHCVITHDGVWHRCHSVHEPKLPTADVAWPGPRPTKVTPDNAFDSESQCKTRHHSTNIVQITGFQMTQSQAALLHS